MPKFTVTSIAAYRLCVALLLAASLFYYPKWTKPQTEATISWDVSGYYLYLPGALIYQDLKELKWWGAIEEKYHPGPGMGQAFQHPSGSWVMKYPMGQALQFLPWFGMAHLLAEPLGYPADGFSLPYQAAISWGSLLVAFLGLWFLRKVLKVYFNDLVVAIVLICLVFGSNYLEYASITGAMTHNWLFTLYTILIFSTIQFYKKPTFTLAALIGLLVGWATITRPTEIIAAMIPLFWGLNSLDAVKARFALLGHHLPKLTLAAAFSGAMIFLQMAYWKYAAGEWIVYSYQGQTFTWLPPHIEDVLWSARAGWLVYSPMMLFAVIGIFMLRKRLPEVFPTIFSFCMIALYITAAWDIWWYGGSLGQRAMVQAYPLWAFGLGAMVQWLVEVRTERKSGVGFLSKAISLLAIPLAAGCIYLNLWWSHQAHRGGLFVSEQMTRAYMLKVLGRFEVERDWLKLLDTREEFKGKERHRVLEAYSNNFESDTLGISTTELAISGTKSLILNKEKQFSPIFSFPRPTQGFYNWCRASVTFQCSPKEWDWWRMTQFVVRFKNGEKTVKERMIRLQRHVDGNESKSIFFDTKFPREYVDQVEVLFWNADSDKTIRLDDLKVEVFIQ